MIGWGYCIITNQYFLIPISTYIWIVTNKKPPNEKEVGCIFSGLYEKSLMSKKEISDNKEKEKELFNHMNFQESEISKIY